MILEGNDLDDLILQGLKDLNKTKDEVKIEILEKGKILMGIPIKKYKIKISVSNLSDDEIEDELKKIEDEIENHGFFEITYLKDGVYLSVYGGLNTCVSYEDVIKKVKLKKIENYDKQILQDTVNNMEGNPIRFAPFQQEIPIDADVIIDISQDKMNAFITLIPPEGGKDMDISKALSKIAEKIRYGLDINEVKRVIEEKLYNRKILIASGQNPVDGKDGFIDFKFKLKENIAPQILEDGSVDYRNLGLITNVKKGDILSEIIPPTEGNPGTNVFGQVLPNKKGKEKKIKYGKNVVVSEDGKYLISDSDGHVYFDKDKLVVHEVYEVLSNVDNSTGNIEFNGAVRIKGSVLTGFEVVCEGDIEVEGVVEGAIVKSDGSIVLKRGVQGFNKARLVSKGDISSRFIENCCIYSEGSVNAEAIMHSEVMSKGIIRVEGKKGLIVGGICKATKEIHAKTIGSSMATTTIVEVGVDPNIRTKQDNIKTEIENTELSINKLDQTISLLNRLAKNNKLEEDKKQILIKSLRTRTILAQKIEDLKSKIEQIDYEIELLSKGKIKVQNIIYPGVKIIVGNSVMFVREEIKYCTIYSEKGSVKIGPYEM